MNDYNIGLKINMNQFLKHEYQRFTFIHKVQFMENTKTSSNNQ